MGRAKPAVKRMAKPDRCSCRLCMLAESQSLPAHARLSCGITRQSPGQTDVCDTVIAANRMALSMPVTPSVYSNSTQQSQRQPKTAPQPFRKAYINRLSYKTDRHRLSYKTDTTILDQQDTLAALFRPGPSIQLLLSSHACPALHSKLAHKHK